MKVLFLRALSPPRLNYPVTLNLARKTHNPEARMADTNNKQTTPIKNEPRPDVSYVPRLIERKWQDKWEADKLYHAVIDESRPKHYALTMLPYPSGDLHIGHWYAMTPSDARARYTVRFYIVAILFLIFDVETIFLFPWAVRYRALGWFGVAEVTVFLAILIVGYIWAYKKGALEWV